MPPLAPLSSGASLSGFCEERSKNFLFVAPIGMLRFHCVLKTHTSPVGRSAIRRREEDRDARILPEPCVLRLEQSVIEESSKSWRRDGLWICESKLRKGLTHQASAVWEALQR